MSSYQESYCNITTDLQLIVPNIDDYDRKRVIEGLVVHSGDVDKKDNSGFVSQLFRDGADLGAAQANLGAVTADGEWFYDSTTDTLYIFNTNAPDTYLFEAGQDWADLKTRVVAEAAERMRSYINRPIMKRSGTGQQGSELRDYDWIVYYSNAALACAELMRPVEPEAATELENSIIDNSGDISPPMGLLDRLKRGEYKLWNEPSQATAQGVVTEKSLDATTTGTVIDTLGEAGGISYDEIEVVIVTGGTITPQTPNTTVSYKVLVRDDEGFANSEAVSETVIDNGFQSLAYGLLLRFSPGVYVANDTWIIRVSGLPEERPSGIKVISLQRNP